ncbi:multiple monosaccharide ABC transporter permease [Streptomyces asoensis]|uniref:multiple monosaccharide ABC transporter permease n=1 Tax=Streptomyces TaxID=1883 RepID=UPI00190A0881|nr:MULTISPECIES: multiple monosaccharide ABC transporter permease [unclassified Streptomyces]MBK3630384.1 sugar ABC transporter permease [Streptomyces sp. MBT49]MBK3635983.1 sugar ABC transporter permease [Streptomyces sp. MBT97]
MSRITDLQKNLFGGTTSNARQFGMISTLVAIVLLFQIWTDGLTLTSGNLIAVVSQYSYILILAIGMLMVIVAGHIDLSVGSVAAFTGIVVAKAMQEYDLPWPLGILLGLLVGVAIGAWQGFWVAYIGVPAFIVTLAGMLLFRGGNQYIGNADTVPVPEGFRKIGAGFLPEVGPDTGYNNLTLLLGAAACAGVVWREWKARQTRQEMKADTAPLWVTGIRLAVMIGVIVFATLRFAGGRVGTSLPISGIILIVLVLAYSHYTRNTIGGRHIYAVGGNARAAELSGVKLKRVNFLVMTNMSVLAALAGMIFVARSSASGPQDGLSWELDAIAAVFIGGAAVSGGLGTVSGSIVGGLVMALLNNGLQLEGVGSDMVQIIKGLVLLLAVAFDVYNKSQGRFSIIGTLTRPFRRDDVPAPPSAAAPDSGADKATIAG